MEHIKSPWDKIFQTDTSLTEEEREQALSEMAQAFASIEQCKASPEHERIKVRIAKMLGTPPDAMGC